MKFLYENTTNPIEGGIGDHSLFDIELLVKGAMIEKEHVGDLNDPKALLTALDIVRDHLTESPRYYDELEKMEEKL
jgi:hypothetical protein